MNTVGRNVSFSLLTTQALFVDRPSWLVNTRCCTKWCTMFELICAAELTHMSAFIRLGLVPYYRHPPPRVGTFDRKLMKMIDRRNSHQYGKMRCWPQCRAGWSLLPKIPHTKSSFVRQRSASLSHGFLCVQMDAQMGTRSNSVRPYPVGLRRAIDFFHSFSSSYQFPWEIFPAW